MQTIDDNFTPIEDDKYLTSLYLKKHEDLVIHITPKIKNSNVLNVLSFCGTNYDQFFSKYDWDTLEYMLRCLLIPELITSETDDDIIRINPIHLTEHFFKKFKKFKNVIPVFYPNIVTDLKDIKSYDYCFSRFIWFYCVYGDRNYPPFFDDSCTNYNDIINMFIQILKHFDDWYWNHYDGDNVVETSLVEDIADIYKTIEKFYYPDKNKTANEIDETLEKASCYI